MTRSELTAEAGAVGLSSSVKQDCMARVNQIFTELFEIPAEELKPEKHLFNDLGLDSLDAIDLMIRFQKEFKIKPANEEMQAIRSLDDVYSLVLRYYEARH